MRKAVSEDTIAYNKRPAQSAGRIAGMGRLSGGGAMLRIVICCLGGGSSFFVTRHIIQEIQSYGYTERATFGFAAFRGLVSIQDKYDIAMICPHQEYEIKRNPDAYHIPVYVIPMVMYGLMSAEDLIEDAEDLMEVWAAGAKNPVTFPDEPRSMTCGRTVSHRKMLQRRRK